VLTIHFAMVPIRRSINNISMEPQTTVNYNGCQVF